MKKLFALIAVAVLVLSGCTNNTDDGGDNDGDDTPVIVEVGTASVTSLSGTDYNAEKASDGKLQVNTAYATVALDADKKIVYIDIDIAQNAGTFSDKGEIVKAEAIPTKTERKDDYGMAGISPIGKEWYEQMAAFEEWAMGQTVADVVGMKTKELDEKHPTVPDVEDLKSSVTIDVGEFLAVLEKAAANAVEVEGVAKIGSGSYTELSAKAAAEGVDGNVQFDIAYAGVAVDKDGKIVYVSIDVAQNKGTFDAAGKVLSAEAVKTKHEKQEEYGMLGVSQQVGIGKEWFEQMTAFEEWAVGQTVADVTGMKTKALDDKHPTVPDVEDLKSSVSMDVGAFLKALDKAAMNATELAK
jgi:uncharacterized lipoprotein NlpE involved in copper resistance